MKQLALDFASQPLPTLDNFVAGRNGELLANVRRVVSGQATERFLYLWGRPGSGRSHLLRGAMTALQRAGTAVAYVACTPDTRPDEGLKRMDCVALDDVDQLGEDGQIAVFGLYNVLRERGAGLLASGSAPPVQLKLREDLVTRLAWGLVYQVHALSDEEKARALAEYAAGRGFRLMPEVCDYLLTRSSRDLSSLLAMLDALDRYSMESKRPVTVPLARELLNATERDAGGRR